MSPMTTAGRELNDSCSLARPENPQKLLFSMATLLCTPMQHRTLSDLENAGVFVEASRRDELDPNDADLLLSDIGLQLWLRYAAEPSAYPTVFVDALMADEFPALPSSNVAIALRVLIACGRDKTNNVPASEVAGDVHLPLSHLCSHVAVEWLPTLLDMGACARQTTASGVPLITTAMAAEAKRLYLNGCDLLVAHDALFRLGKMLLSHGADLTQPALTGSLPVVLLAFNGYCAAADVLLSLGAACNTAQIGREGNTLMHQLAATTRLRPHSFSAYFLFILAMRYGGDPDRPNNAGVTPVSLLPDSLVSYLRLTQKMVKQARERAVHVIANSETVSDNQTTNNVPATSATLLREAKRLCDAGHDPLLAHEALFALAASLQQRGMDLTQPHSDGTLPVIWLASQGFCGAAEVLLAFHPDCNAPVYEGNSIMHCLAMTTHHPRDAIYADYMLNTALRYGGDPTRPDNAGNTALMALSAERVRFVRAGFFFIQQTRKRVAQIVEHRRAPRLRQQMPSQRDAPADPLRHSAAAP
ncbi:ankyrin [Pandoraea sputorum]|nr:ankyrin [Pandoraea sputorum]